MKIFLLKMLGEFYEKKATKALLTSSLQVSCETVTDELL